MTSFLVIHTVLSGHCKQYNKPKQLENIKNLFELMPSKPVKHCCFKSLFTSLLVSVPCGVGTWVKKFGGNF